MINISNKSLCESCFAEITEEPCKVCGHSPSEYVRDPSVLPCGSALQGRYAVGRVIGMGGFGITYLAYDTKLERKIAIKEFFPFGLAARKPDSADITVSTNKESADVFRNGAQKFYDEARMVAGFNGNQNIVSVYDFFYENSTAYYTMEYLQGQTLKSRVVNNGVLNKRQAVFIAECISQALVSVHAENVLHRDISPDNIMICSDGKVKLIDFGAARQVVADGSQNLSVILKPGFAPLEQYQKRGKQGPWTDIYSLGTTLFYSLTGIIPDDPMTRLEDDEKMGANTYGIDNELWNIIQKSTMLKIGDRYANISELISDLENISYDPEPMIKVPSMRKKAKPSVSNEVQPSVPEQQDIPEEQPVPEQQAAASVQSVPEQLSPSKPVKEVHKSAKPRKKLPTFVYGIAASAAVVVIAVIGIVLFGGDASEEKLTEETSTAVSVSEVTHKETEAAPKSVIIGGETFSTDMSETINLSNMKLTDDDIKELKSMTNVTSIILNGNELTDLSVLSGLTQLEKLSINNNNVTDLSFVKKMKNLKSLSAKNNDISDISALTDLNKLETLSLSDNKITDISPLSGKTKLEKVYVSDNKITDLTPLADSKGLKVLNADNNSLNGKYIALRGLTICEELHIQGNGFDSDPDLLNSYLSYFVSSDENGYSWWY